MFKATLILVGLAIVGCDTTSPPTGNRNVAEVPLPTPSAAHVVAAASPVAASPAVAPAAPLPSTDASASGSFVAQAPAAVASPSSSAPAPVSDGPAAPPAPPRAWLGVSRWLAHESDVVLCGVLADGPAAKAGLQTGDVIRAVDNQEIHSLAGFDRAIETGPLAKPVAVAYERRGEPKTMLVTLEAMPEDGGIAQFKAAAEAGQAWAMCELGLRQAFYNPQSARMKHDPQAAVFWFRRALDVGNSTAPLFLGIMHMQGLGVETDYAEARRLLMQAREATGDGIPRGMAAAASQQLAVMCLRGAGLEPDPTLALRFFRDAADRGSPAAMHRIGTMFAAGIGVAQDDSAAAFWFRKAAARGYQPAQQAIVDLLAARGLVSAAEPAKAKP